MPATDFQESASSSSGFGLSILSRRRDQVHSMESTHEATGLEAELSSFQTHVSECFQELAAMETEKVLSIAWIRKLLDAFLSCQEEFKLIVLNNKAYLNKPPMDRYISDFFERSVKALDVCNAIRDGIEQIRQLQKQLEIVLYALDNQRTIGQGQFRRAKKALVDLTLGVLEGKDSNTTVAHRNRSFGRNNVQREQTSMGHCRSLSWSVSRTWSAAKQLQAISSNLVAPRANEITSTNGLNVAVFTMNYVLLFVMWALVAAIPCQDRGLQTHFIVTRYEWAVPIHSLHEKIVDLSKKRDRRNACGLLKEIYKIEECARHLNELIDSVLVEDKDSQFKMPAFTEEKERQVKMWVGEVRMVYQAVKEGLDPLERQVREVFHRIVRSRTEGLSSIGRAND